MLLGAGSLYMSPSEAGALTCPMHADIINTSRSSKGRANVVLGQSGCDNSSSRVDFAVPAGAEAIRFSEGTKCCVGRAEVADLQELWFSSSVQSNLRHRHLSQLDVDAILNMEMVENLLYSSGRERQISRFPRDYQRSPQQQPDAVWKEGTRLEPPSRATPSFLGLVAKRRTFPLSPWFLAFAPTSLNFKQRLNFLRSI